MVNNLIRRSRISIIVGVVACAGFIGVRIHTSSTEHFSGAEQEIISTTVPTNPNSDAESVPIEEISEQLEDVGLESVTTTSGLYPETSILVSDEGEQVEDCTAEFHIDDPDEDGQIDVSLGLVSYTTHMTDKESLDQNMFDGTFMHGDVDTGGRVDSHVEVADTEEAVDYIEEVTDFACERYIEHAEEVGITQ